MIDERVHLLATFAEECAEVQQRVSKAVRFGIGEVEAGQVLNNSERIVYELYDLLGVAEMLEERGIIRINRIEQRQKMDAKKAKVLKFMDYARMLGELE